MQEARRLEAVDPLLAAHLWRQAMPMIPDDSVEYQRVAAHAGALSSGAFQYQTQAQPLEYGRPESPPETWQSAVLKTGGSMALSMAIYAQFSDWQFAVGFVLLILIHELGHVVANWHYGIKQGPPIFLPFAGAVIVLKQNPPDAKAEAVIGIAWPIAGTFGALCCYALFLYTRLPVLAQVAELAFAMNLFNLIPVWPLDGGRVAAGITPVLWLPGVAMFAWFIFGSGGATSAVSWLIAFWIFRSTIPQIRDVVFRGGMRLPYFRIGAPARIAVLVSYLLLVGLLIFMALPMFPMLHL